MEIFISNIYSVLKTKEKELLKALGKKYSAKAPGYEFTPAYRQGRWRGDKFFFDPKTGKFGTGLLSSILEDLDFLDRDYTLTDSRDVVTLESYEVEGISFRDYQDNLIRQALDKKGCIIKSPTGSGKTVILAGILNALRDCTGVVFFNKKQLLSQTSKFLTKHGIEHGIAFGDGVDIKPITLCTIQSIDKVLHSHVRESDFLIFDEIHEFAKGKMASKVLKSFPKAAYRIGLTATPPKDRFSKLNLVSFLGGIIEVVTAEDLVEEGYLTLPSIQILELPDVDLRETEGLSYPEMYSKYIIENDIRNKTISDIVNSIEGENSKILVLTKNLSHAQILLDLIPGSIKLEGKDSLQDREDTLKRFVEEKGPSVIIGTIIFQTGVDIPELTHLINARGLKSEIATVQALGRTLRKHENKSQVFIYDFIDKVPYLGKHSKRRIDAYKSLNFNIEFHGKAFKKRK